MVHRAVRFTAIWETDRNQILFYGPQGERFLKTQLIEAPALESALPHKQVGLLCDRNLT